MLYITMEYYSAFKKREILSFAATLMTLVDIMLNEIMQVQKDKYIMITHTRNLKKSNSQKQRVE